MKKYHLLFPCIFLSFNCSINYASSNSQMLAVVEENAGHVSFYNHENGKKLGSLEVGYLPHEIAVSKDGKTAYVSNFGIKDYDSGIGTPGASISVIDIPTRLEKYRLYTFDPYSHKDYSQIDSAPHGVKLRPDNENLLYVNTEKGGKVIVFDLTSRSILKKFNVSPNTHNLFFSSDGKTLWLMAGKDGIMRMDPDTGKILGSFVLPTPIRGLKYTPDSQSLMLSAVNQIVFIDPITLKVQKEFNNLGVGPILYSDITPDQKYIIAPAAFDNQILIIDVKTKMVIKRIVTGLNPIMAMVDAEGKHAYVSNATDKHVTKIDMQTFSTSNLYTKEGPNGLAFVSYNAKQPHKKLNLGVALPLSGPDALRGRDMMRGYEYWRLMVARAGGLLVQGQVYDINIVYLDTQSDINKIAPLTKELISSYQTNILLSTYGAVAYNIEKQIALENQLPLTPAQTNENAWLPNEMAVGKDYFITTQFYDKKYYAEYNFKASTYSAAATSLGLAVQDALNETNSFDYEKLFKAMSHQHLNFFQY